MDFIKNFNYDIYHAFNNVSEKPLIFINSKLISKYRSHPSRE